MDYVRCMPSRRLRRLDNPLTSSSYIIFAENNENSPLYGATQAMILAGQKDAKKRVFFFFVVYIISGAMSE